MRVLVVAVLLAACGDNLAARPDSRTDTPIDMPSIDTPSGVTTLDLTGVAYGLYWDAAASALYITNDTANRLDRWTEANGVVAFGTFPTLAVANVLGGIVELSDRSFLVPTLGMGTAGTLLALSSDGASAAAITGLDATRRRVGITLDPDGLLYEAFFTGSGMMSQTGGVGSAVIASGAGTEVAITTSVALKKVTGIVATRTTLYVCDQTVSKIYAITIADGTTTTFASPPSCDLIYQMPNGDLVTGGLTGGIYRITPAGAISNVRSGFEQVRGIAYDAVGKRMFVIENRATMPNVPRLHIFPLDG